MVTKLGGSADEVVQVLWQGGASADGQSPSLFPHDIFCHDVLPSNVECAWPVARHLLASFFNMFHKPLYQMDILLGFPFHVLRAIADDDDPLSIPPVLPSPPFPPDFQLAFRGADSDLDLLLSQAREIGAFLCHTNAPARLKVCSGLAAIEVAQLIMAWLSDDRAPVPHCDLVTAVILSWLKVAEPTSVIVPRFVGASSATIRIEPPPSPHMSAAVYSKARERLKELVLRGLDEPWLSRVAGARTVAEVLAAFHANVCVALDEAGGTNCRISARTRPLGGIEFELAWDELPEDRAAVRGRVISAWVSLLAQLKAGVAVDVLHFVYAWLRAGPVGSAPGTYGSTILVALLMVVGHAPASPLPDDVEMECMALLARGKDEFVEEAGLARLALRQAPKCLPVARLLPNMHVRLQVMRRFPFRNATKGGKA
jgi:hypothetical protein